MELYVIVTFVNRVVLPAALQERKDSFFPSQIVERLFVEMKMKTMITLLSTATGVLCNDVLMRYLIKLLLTELNSIEDFWSGIVFVIVSIVYSGGQICLPNHE